MGIQSNLDLNFWITRGMARRMGVNLSEAMHEGMLSQGEFSDMITTCRVCGRAEQCLALLAEKGASAQGVPADCPNHAVLSELRQLH